MKRRIQLTEQDIVRMVKRAVNEVKLNEMDWRTYKNAEKASNKRRREYDKDYDKLFNKSLKDKNYEKNKDKYDQQFKDIVNKGQKEYARGKRFHDYSDELMNKKHDFDKQTKHGLVHQYASSDPDTKSITLHRDYAKSEGFKKPYEREFKVLRKNSKTPIEHRWGGNKLKYSYDNPPVPFADKSDKHSDLFGDSSRLEKEIMGYNSGKDQYEPGKGWPEYNENLDRRVKKSIRESLNKMNEETFHVGSFPYGGGGVGESTYLQPGEKVKISAPRPGGGYGAHNMVGTILQYNGRTPESDRPSYDVKLANGEILYAVHPRNIVKL